MVWSTIVIILQVIFLEGVLSIDNAAILSSMVSHLPDHAPVPWPAWLRRFEKPLNKLFGFQRSAALRVGLFGAYAGRALMLLIVSFIIQNPWLKLIGGLYLIRLAVEDLSKHGTGTEADNNPLPSKSLGFWAVVLNLNLMDMAFSLDNVVAVVSLSDHLYIIMFGVAVGILVMRFAAEIFTKVIIKVPILQTAAYILVFNIGVELLLEEAGIYEFSDLLKFAISIGTLAICLLYYYLPFMKILRPVFVWLAQGLGIINSTISWALRPISGLIGLITSLFRKKQPVSID
ncbi:MAG TPA: hypothetical protein PKD55_07555 [Bellilinea sp.]|nr:hypothetical protein [Bellilinea sp.]